MQLQKKGNMEVMGKKGFYTLHRFFILVTFWTIFFPSTVSSK